MNRSQVLAAMDATLLLAEQHGMADMTSDEPELDYAHLRTMLGRAASDVTMPEDKLCRWLGWMQAAVVARCLGEVRLDAMKRINETVSRVAEQMAARTAEAAYFLDPDGDGDPLED